MLTKQMSPREMVIRFVLAECSCNLSNVHIYVWIYVGCTNGAVAIVFCSVKVNNNIHNNNIV